MGMCIDMRMDMSEGHAYRHVRRHRACQKGMCTSTRADMCIGLHVGTPVDMSTGMRRVGHLCRHTYRSAYGHACRHAYRYARMACMQACV